MALSKRFRHYRLMVESVHKSLGEYNYTFRFLDNYDSRDRVNYRGFALNIREDGAPLEPGDIVELDAKHETFYGYDLNLKTRYKKMWIAYPRNKKLIKKGDC